MSGERVDGLLEILQSEGEFDSTGRFTLDFSRARDKMQRFQLVDPHWYGAHLVAAAVASGATRIDVYNDADDLRLDFDGRPFKAVELQNLFSSLFASERDPRLLRLQELAVGINAALGFNPRWVDVESWDDQEGAHLRVDARGERLEKVRGRRAGGVNTRIHVRERVSWRVVSRYLARLSRGPRLPPEGQGIVNRCFLAPVDITINGNPITKTLDWGRCLLVSHINCRPGDLSRRLHYQADQEETLEVAGAPAAVMALRVTRLEQGLTWLVNGLAYSSAWHPDSSLLVRADALTRNVSQSQLVDSEERRRLLQLLEEIRRGQLLRLAQTTTGRGEPDDPVAVARLDILRDQIALEVRSGEPLTPLGEALLQAPIFRLAHGPETSLRPIMDEFSRSGWMFCPITRSRWTQPALDGSLVVQVDALDEACLTRVFGRLGSGDWLLEEAESAERNRRLFEEQLPRAVQLPESVAVSLRLVQTPFVAEMGLVSESEGSLPAARLVALKAGRKVGERAFPGELLPPGLLAVVEHPEWEPNLTWTGLRNEQGALDEVCQALREALPELMERIRERPDMRDHLLAYLSSLHQRREDLGQWLDLEAFPCVGGEVVSLRRLLEQRDRLGLTPITDRPAEFAPLDGSLVLSLTPWQSLQWERLVPPLVSYDRELRLARDYHMARRRWEQGAQVSVRLPDTPYLARIPLQELEGELGLPPAYPATTARALFFREGRELGTRFFPSAPRGQGGLPAGLHVAAGHDQLPANRDWSGVNDGPVLDQVMEVVQAHIPDLFEALGRAFPEFAPARLWAQAYLAAYLDWWGALGDLPVSLLNCPALDGLGQARHSLGEVLAELQTRGRVKVLVNEEPLEAVEGLEGLWLRLGHEVYRALDNLVGPTRLVPSEEEYLQASYRQEHHTRPQEPPVLAPGTVVLQPFAGSHGEHGEIGIRRISEPGAPNTGLVRVLKSGRHLTDWVVPLGTSNVPTLSSARLRAVACVEAPDLTPTAGWDEAEPGPARTRLEAELRQAFEELWKPLSEGLHALAGPERDERLAYLWGQLCLEESQSESAGLYRAPLFPTAGGNWLSLADLRTFLADHPRVGYLLYAPEAPLAGDEPVVVVRRELLPLFRALVGVQNTAEATTTIKSWARAQDYESLPRIETLELPEGPYLGTSSLGPPREGLIGLRPELNTPSSVRLLRERRSLGTRNLQRAFCIEAVVNDDHLRPNRQFTDVHAGLELEECLRAVEQAAVQLVMRVAVTWLAERQERGQLRPYLLQLACRLERDREPGQTLWHLPLLAGSEQEHSLAGLGPGPWFYLPGEQTPPPQVAGLMPPGKCLLRLEDWEVEALSQAAPVIDYRAGLGQAQAIAALPDLGAPRLNHPNSIWGPLRDRPGEVEWLPDSRTRILELRWRSRFAGSIESDGFPGWRAVAEISDLPLGPEGVAGTEDVARQITAQVRELLTQHLRTAENTAESRALRIRLALGLGLAPPWEAEQPLEHEILTRRVFPIQEGAPRSLQGLARNRLTWEWAGRDCPRGTLLLTELEHEPLERLLENLPHHGDKASHTWLARIDISEDDLEGWLGVPMWPAAQAGLELVHGTVQLGRYDLFEGPGVVGLINADFGRPPVDLELAQERLRPAFEELMERLCQVGEDYLDRARELLASWAPWHDPKALPEAIRQAPLFVRVDGGRASLEELLRQPTLHYCREGEAGPAAALRLHPQDPAWNWLLDLTGRLPVHATGSAPPDADLLGVLHHELLRLEADPRLVGLLARTTLVPLEGTLADCVDRPDGPQPRLNRGHPLVRRLEREPRSPLRFYALEALVSQIAAHLRGSGQDGELRRIHTGLVSALLELESL